MEKYYLTDYLLKEKIKLKFGKINSIISPCGSGKTSFIYGSEYNNKKGLLYNTKELVEGGGLLYNLPLAYRKSKILYVTDSVMNVESISKKTAFKMFDFDEYINNSKNDSYNPDDILNGKTGEVLVMTYAKLAGLLSSKNINFKNSLKTLTSYSCIILDEWHNLINYSIRYDETNTKYKYYNLIDNLNMIASKTLVVALTATPQKIRYYCDIYTDLNINNVLSENDLKYIVQHIERETYTSIDMRNIINEICNNNLLNGRKALIYTKKIETCRRWRNKLNKAGFNAEFLCTKDKCDPQQLELRDYILDKKDIPENLDILLVNDAYTTGFDILDKSERIQVMIANTYDETEKIQSRNRIRHDIDLFIYKHCEHAKDKVYEVEILNKSAIINLDDFYIGRKLEKGEFAILKNNYGISQYHVRESVKGDGTIYTETSRLTDEIFIQQLNDNGYEYKNGTIYREGEIMNEEIELIEYLKNLVGKKLYKEDREELIEKLNLRDGRNRLQKKVSTLNGYLLDNYNMMLISKKVKEKGKLVTVWLLNNI